MVKATSKGQGSIPQYRLGRTAYRSGSSSSDDETDAEAGVGAVWVEPMMIRGGDQTRRFLRRSHLDELPQIFNVVRGDDMCFVGPRPERPEIVEQIAKRVPRYLDRLAATPGVSGMAQLHLASDKTIDCVFKKLGFDFAYIERASFRPRSDRLPGDRLQTRFPKIGRMLCSRLAGSKEFIAAAMEAGARLQQDVGRRSPPAASAGQAVVRHRVGLEFSTNEVEAWRMKSPTSDGSPMIDVGQPLLARATPHANWPFPDGRWSVAGAFG